MGNENSILMNIPLSSKCILYEDSAIPPTIFYEYSSISEVENYPIFDRIIIKPDQLIRNADQIIA